MRQILKSCSLLIISVYSTCIFSYSLVNLTHYIHHMVTHTLYEHEHLHGLADHQQEGLHDHTHGGLLDRLLHEIDRNEDPDHDHDLMTIILADHVPNGKSDLSENKSVSTGYLVFLPDITSLFSPDPAKPPPRA